jgi:hypothetical protein
MWEMGIATRRGEGWSGVAFPRSGFASERALQMFDREQSAVGGERHADRVEPQLVGVRPIRALDQPASGQLANLAALGLVQRLEGPATVPVQAPGLDLAEGQYPPVERDDVELSPAGAVVALDDLKAAPDEVLCGKLLA